ncbi:MAG: hypothetical protein KF773_03580 [Deltaproteobacteria bacterium]|nr:hypothetical protein [Deltaproteobacteria bacterium]MCW5801654.1 hypothetical protein [Deltaproteobacteria bacterium]
MSDQLILLLAHVRSLRDEVAQLRVRGIETIAEIAEIQSVTTSCCDDTREMLFRLRSSATEMLLPTAR